MQDLETILRQTLADHQLSRSERKALAAVFADAELDAGKRAWLQHRAFALATAELGEEKARRILDWLEDVVKTLASDVATVASGRRATACFSPGEECLKQINGLLATAQRKVDICVFTITDDRIASAIADAHRRNVDLRIISDDDKSGDEGSDIRRLARLGVPVKLDRSEYHMHHKFAIFDDATLLTGSYNWTRGAASYNEENLVVLAEAGLVARFRDEFERLWDRL